MMDGRKTMFEGKPILVYDIECSSLDINEAKAKWFGAYSYMDEQYHLIPWKNNERDIKELITRHKILVGFNNKEFDNPIILNNINQEDIFNYKVLIDILEISAPKVGKKYGKYRKNRLVQMGIKLKSFTLKNIIEKLKLDENGTKGDIDYNIFQKDEWTTEEITEIKIYLKQDIELTKKLFEWYEVQYNPLKKFLPKKDQDNFLYLKSSLSVLAYNIICNKAGLPVEYGEAPEVKTKSYAGGHHIEPRRDLVVGNIIEVDFTSAYPHAIMMGNLHSFTKEDEEGWTGDGYYNIQGKYNNKEQGKVELALKDIFLERLKAKKAGQKEKDKSYKIIINSLYGCIGNPVFKSIYNRNSASDCTSIVRTWMKKLAHTLEINGFICIYGFTDSIFVEIPSRAKKEEMLFIIEHFIDEAQKHLSFPMDTFKMGIEEELKMFWFVAKNCYLFVTNKNEVKYKSTLLNTNTPKAVMKLFEEYMKPIIIEELNIPFTKKELEEKIKLMIEMEPELAAQEYKVGELSDYKVESSLHYQISKRYGVGRHFLIPNKANIGVGLSKSTKKKRGIRHCTIEEFKSKNLKVNDIELKHLITHLKPFYERNEKKDERDNYRQTLL
jgi:DNA polymerase elongation subunit (family B)